MAQFFYVGQYRVSMAGRYEPIVRVREEQPVSAFPWIPEGRQESNRLYRLAISHLEKNYDPCRGQTYQSSKSFVQEAFQEIGLARTEVKWAHMPY
jgi:hypothetical protein